MSRSALTVSRARGFTLIEALAALLLVAIVLPVVMHGVSLATRAGASAKRQTQAVSLARSKLAELIATKQWKAGALSGNFDDMPGDGSELDYAWTAETTSWKEQYVKQLDVRVTWTSAGMQKQLTLTSLVYEGKPKKQDEEDTTTTTGGGTQ
jgi:general secretion pathway protein I